MRKKTPRQINNQQYYAIVIYNIHISGINMYYINMYMPFSSEIGHFQIKLGSLLNKTNPFEIKLDIVQNKPSSFHIKLVFSKRN